MDEDTVQRLKGGLTFMLEFYKICMGTFLTVFVPHQCYEENSLGSQSVVCSISHNIYHGDDYHRRIIWFNLFSFIVFVLMYCMEIKRENWCINYLDIDYSKSAENLDDEIEDYPVFKYKMHELNKRYDNLVKFCSLTQLFNISVSVADVGRSWAGSASFTPMLSYIILIASKLHTSYTVATASLKNERAYSAYLKGPKTYNTIDSDHRNVIQETDIKVEMSNNETPSTTDSDSCESSHKDTRDCTVVADTASPEDSTDTNVVDMTADAKDNTTTVDTTTVDTTTDIKTEKTVETSENATAENATTEATEADVKTEKKVEKTEETTDAKAVETTDAKTEDSDQTTKK